ncbi:MAG: DUF1559 domain-containing protein [Planctomycetes bacterium]|nr:DUF1559 domain-containing protein [Planctomycetota bacterium]
MIDLMVSIAVIAVLIGLLLPSLASVNETARRVVCQSNVRQIGLGLVMYANDHDGQLPSSRFISTGLMSRAVARPDKMLMLRVGDEDSRPDLAPWDGLGVLYSNEYIPAAKVFYCPSHRGDNPYSAYATSWNGLPGEIVCNYHFRGEGPSSIGVGARTTNNLWAIDPAQSSLIADGMRVRSDCNHQVGVNFFRADLTVHWFNDPTGNFADRLPITKNEASPEVVIDAWQAFDQSANAERN